ncbi:hypothetical protein GGR57DRAFT_518626 [Xylariaceae sp. FL1272]|nr:hypothetical protein GGR57DRAFT_518626 [Xylariaceae sp. FL1272]
MDILFDSDAKCSKEGVINVHGHAIRIFTPTNQRRVGKHRFTDQMTRDIEKIHLSPKLRQIIRVELSTDSSALLRLQRRNEKLVQAGLDKATQQNVFVYHLPEPGWEEFFIGLGVIRVADVYFHIPKPLRHQALRNMDTDQVASLLIWCLEAHRGKPWKSVGWDDVPRDLVVDVPSVWEGSKQGRRTLWDEKKAGETIPLSRNMWDSR